MIFDIEHDFLRNLSKNIFKKKTFRPLDRNTRSTTSAY